MAQTETPDSSRNHLRPTGTTQTYIHESEDSICFSSGQDVHATLLAAGILLEALRSGASSAELDIAIGSDFVATPSTWFDNISSATCCAISLDWSCQVHEILDAVNDQNKSREDSSIEQNGDRGRNDTLNPTGSISKTLFVSQRPLVDSTAVKAASRDTSSGNRWAHRYTLLICPILSTQGRLRTFTLFNEAYYTEFQIQSSLRQYSHLVRTLCQANKHDLLASLDLLPPDERKQLWDTNSHVPPAIDDCVHCLIQRHTQECPQSPAVHAWDGSLTYEELDRLSDRLSGHLQSTGVRTESSVVIVMDKSLWVSVAIMATLKAGGAIVMIDPYSAPEVAKVIVEEANARIGLVDHDRFSIMNELVEHAIVVHSDSIDSVPHRPIDRENVVQPSNTAWIIFTSGSTGKPKGVVLSHNAICTGAVANGKVKYMNKDSRVFQFSNHVFDGAIQDYLFAWIAGGCVCVPSEKERQDDLAGCMNRFQISWTFLTPSVASLLSPKDVPSLKVLALGGEALTVENVKTWAGVVTLQNAYGPAECTVACAVGEFRTQNDNPNNIGYPVGSVLWVCNPDCHDQLVPLGCVGELLVEGPMLARGYLANPTATAKAFIQNPQFLNCRSGLVYKTGDLVRQERDGNFVYLGRRDDQVKVRGQRIEIAGLNAFLARSETVKHAYLSVPKTGRLAGNFVCVLSLKGGLETMEAVEKTALLAIDDSLATKEVIDTLHDSMAGNFVNYMTPDIWIPVQDLPLSNSAKIDGMKIRKWLEHEYTPMRSPLDLDPDTEALVTDVEVKMQSAWSELLAVEKSSIERRSSFFGFGGNSLQAMGLAARLRKVGVTLSVANVLRYPVFYEMVKSASNHDEHEAGTVEDVGMIDIDRVHVAEQCGVPIENIEDIYPAAPIQEALLTLTSMDTGAYVVHRRFNVAENVDIVRLQEAWSKICIANPILRSRIVHFQGHGTVQVVTRTGSSWLDNVGSDQDWDFGRPLVRVYFTGRQLTMSLHHAIYDGWSLPLVLQDLEYTYHEGQVAPRPSFKTFVNYLSTVDRKNSENFWTSALLDSSAAQFPAMPSQSYQPSCTESVHCRIACLTASRKLDFTPATLATAAWAVVLCKYTGLNDVCFGHITSGRFIPLDAARDIIGPLVATMPLRKVIDFNASTLSFLQQMQVQLLDMIPHVHYGLQQLRDISTEAKEAASFNNTFVVHLQDEVKDSSTILKPADVDVVNPADFRTYPLHMACTLYGDELEAKLTFDPAVISMIQCENLMDYFDRVLRTLMEGDGECSLQDVLRPLVTQTSIIPDPAPELRAVESCVHDLFDAEARARPNAPAVCSLDTDLTYLQLQDLSDRLAHELIRRGVVQETSVGFSFEKSSLPIVAILAIMKSGGVCVPLDISLPIERTRVIVEKSRPQIVVCDKRRESVLREIAELELLVVDLAILRDLSEPRENLTVVVQPSHVCYTLFTSGSTGEPKGVVWEHRTLASSSLAHGKAMYIRSSSRVFQFSAFLWDISVCEIITTLLHGGCVCVPSEEDRLNNTVASMIRMKVNWTWFTPSFARSMPLTDAQSLETLVLGGEVIGEDNVERYRNRFRLLTGYGPTECCVVASVADFSTDKMLSSGHIGAGVGSMLWIVDPEDYQTLVPIGAPGEILIEGPIVGREYLRDKERSHAVFVGRPAWASQEAGPASRMYLSGDLGRMNADRSVTFLGRKDEQVKVRGQRLELGEVEHHLLQCPGVQHAVVFVPTSKSHQGRLVCVVASSDLDNNEQKQNQFKAVENTDQIQQIQKRLSTVLPPFAIPTSWLVLDKMPHTPARKLDRGRVRRWAIETLERTSSSHIDTSRNLEEAIVTPTTSNERLLRNAWSEILNIAAESIGTTQSFIGLGGDSIRAIRLVGLLRSQGLLLSVSAIMRHQTLRDMAVAISLPVREEDSGLAPFTLLSDRSDMQEARSGAARLCSISSDKIEDIYPATPLQEAVMALDGIYKGSYFAQLIYEAPSVLDASRLARAWHMVAKQHTILRSRLVHLTGFGTMQVVVDDGPALEEVTDLEAYLKADAEQMIGLGDPIARLAVSGRNLILTAHHAAYDGVSLPLIIGDIEKVYLKEAVPLRPPFRRYVQYLQDRETQSDEAFWTSYLENYNPIDFPRKGQANRSKSFEMVIDKRHQHSFTTATYAQATWALLLAGYSDASDVCFGTTLSGRDVPVPEISTISGPTLATLPVRFLVERTALVHDFLQNVQSTGLDVMEHQHLGVQHIRRLVGGASDFRTMLVVFPPADQETSSEWCLNLKRSTGYLDNFSMYSLAMMVQLTKGGAIVTLNYDSDIIGHRQASRILDFFQSVFDALRAAARDQLVQGVMQVSDQDCKEIEAWNATLHHQAKGYVHGIISQQAEKFPSAPAISAWDGDMTFGELESWSNRLSWDLCTRGVVPGHFVAFCCVKSKWTIVAMLAILKAKAAFVPLNPSDSIERKRRLVQQHGIQITVTSASIFAEHRDLASEVISLDEGFLNSLPEDGEVHTQDLAKDDPAYMIFTSGSTGVPKAPVISHGALTTSIVSLINALALSRQTRCLQFASYVFDLSLLEIMGTLVAGGCLGIPSDSERMDDLTGAVQRLRANFTVLTPTVLRTLEPSDFPTLETVVLGGEVVGSDNIANWSMKFQLFSVWAPSETTIANTVVRLRKPEQSGELGPSVNARLWLVQPRNVDYLAAIGAPGEILVEGHILALGYHGDFVRTAAAFIEAPGWATPGSRFYRTGDIARYEEDGGLYFLGRADGQVKVRGQRTDLEEIEHHLYACENVRHCAVSIPESGPHTGKLVAIISLPSQKQGSETSNGDMMIARGSDISAQLSDIEQSLVDSLPKHAIPSVFIPLTRMPQTASGKVDRARIRSWLSHLSPDTLSTRNSATSSPNPPRGAIEQQIQQTWSQILNISAERVARDTSFFQLGGDSITAMQTVSLLRQRGLGLTVQTLMRYKTIAKIAEQATSKTDIEATRRDEIMEEDFGLSPVQELFAGLGAVENRFHQSFLLACNASVNMETLRRALGSIVERHSMLRMRLVRSSTDSTWRQVVMPLSEKNICVITATCSSDAGLNNALEQVHALVDIENGPVIVTALIKTPTGLNIFLAAHHMAIDLVSWRTLLDELEQTIQGKPFIPTTSTSFQQSMQSQKEHVAKMAPIDKNIPFNISASDLEYWGIGAKQNPYRDVVEQGFDLDEKTTRRLFGPANQAFGTETIDLLLAGLWSSFVQTFPDRSAPAIFNELHGREPLDASLDIASTIGWFTAIQPLSTPLTPDASIAEIVIQVKDLRRSVLRSGWVAAFNHAADTSQLMDFFGGRVPVEIVFNFAGQFQQLERSDSLLHMRTDFRRRDQGPEMQRLGLFEVSAVVNDSRLRVSLSYNQRISHIDRVGLWMRQFQGVLSHIASDLPQRKVQYTSTDFPLLQISPAQMPELTSSVMPRLGIEDVSASVEDVYTCVPIANLLLLEQRGEPNRNILTWTVKLTALPGEPQLDATRLVRAWKDVVSRHQMLRSAFFYLPHQDAHHHHVVLKECSPRIVEIQASTIEEASRMMREHPVHIYANDEIQHTFGVCSTPTGDICCRLDMNHAICDGFSVGLLWKELSDAYCGRLPKQPGPLFSDYLAYVQRQPIEANTAYWNDFLKDARPSFVSTGPKPSDPKSGHGLVDLSSAVDPVALHAICRRFDLTVPAVLLTAWCLLVASRTSDLSACVHYAASGRDIEVEGIQDMVGPVLTTPICWLPLRKNESFVSLVSRVQEDHYNHLQHQHMDLTKLRPTPDKLSNMVCSIQALTSLLPGRESGMAFEHVHAIEDPNIDFLFSPSYSSDRLSLLLKFHRERSTNEYASALAADLARVLNTIIEQPLEEYKSLESSRARVVA